MKYQQNILEIVQKAEEKRGIKPFNNKSTTYKIWNALYIVSMAYTVFINACYIIGHLINYLDKAGNTENLNDLKMVVIHFSIATAVLLSGAVVKWFKLYEISAGLIAVPSVYLIFFTRFILTDVNSEVGLAAKFYWYHLFPLALLIISVSVIAVLTVKSKLKTKERYKATVKRLYEEFKKNNESAGEDEWNEYLKNYNN